MVFNATFNNTITTASLISIKMWWKLGFIFSSNKGNNVKVGKHTFWFCIKKMIDFIINQNQTSKIYHTVGGLSWSWSYGSYIYNYLCNQCLSPLTLWFRIPLRLGLLDKTLCDNVCQWLTTGRCFFAGYPGFLPQ
jgi:hypothetical protein